MAVKGTLDPCTARDLDNTLSGYQATKRRMKMTSTVAQVRGVGQRLRTGVGNMRLHMLHGAGRALTYASPSPTKRGQEFAFIVAHPRSGSTLLSLLLGEHDEICATGEHKVAYQNTRDLDALVSRARLRSASRVRSRYVLDKLVRNGHSLSDDLLSHPNVRTIFLVRQLESTIASYGTYFHGPLARPENALRHLRIRLDGMIELAEKVGDRGLFVHYDDIIDKSDETLAAISRHMELSEHLSSTYTVNRDTGNRSWGDKSARLQTGAITARPERSVHLDATLAREAAEIHNAAVQRLRELTGAPRTASA